MRFPQADNSENEHKLCLFKELTVHYPHYFLLISVSTFCPAVKTTEHVCAAHLEEIYLSIYLS